VPVGIADDGLPVGLQIVGDAWDEACVLQVAAELERDEVAKVVKPARSRDLLDGS
jgi:aspartyl-tRNA(Asn)/glutamyl-tRNA(Gln) amidotransferase subunit A